MINTRLTVSGCLVLNCSITPYLSLIALAILAGLANPVAAGRYEEAVALLPSVGSRLLRIPSSVPCQGVESTDPGCCSVDWPLYDV